MNRGASPGPSGGAAADGGKAAAWAAQTRHRFRRFEPLPVRTSIPGLKTVEQDLQEQVKHCNAEVQRDLDLLHQQLMQEVYDSVSQELQAVAQKMRSSRDEVMAHVEPLRAAVKQLQDEARAARSGRDEDVRQIFERIDGSVAGQADDFRRALAAETGALRKNAEQVSCSLWKEVQDVQGDLEKLKAQNTCDSTTGDALSDRWAEPVGALEKRVADLADEVRDGCKLQGDALADLRHHAQDAEVRAQTCWATLEEGLRSEALVCEARFREAQAAVAALENRQQAALVEALAGTVGKSEQVEIRAKYEVETAKASFSTELEERMSEQEALLNHMGAQCMNEVNFACAGMARSVEWEAALDLATLLSTGAADVESPDFTVAGLRPLRLSLRLSRQGCPSGGVVLSPNGYLEAQPGSRPRWSAGAFLRAPGTAGVSFRLSVAGGRPQSFRAEFAECAEWGSQRLAVLERVAPTVRVTLEVLDVRAPAYQGGLPPCMSASVRLQDASEAAAKEAAALRSSLVRRVEWRVSRVSERLASAREAGKDMLDDDALEPLCSPPFAAGGVEGMQLMLYPLGYRPRGEEACGFFLVCPNGLHMKCRAFVGDHVRNFEHHYETREPYGRGSFCRLADKADGDDCVVCGIEILDVRQEQTAQIRGGPFGNQADQLKMVYNPGVGGMEAVRELKDLAFPPGGGGKEKRGKARHRVQPQGAAATATALMRATAPAAAELFTQAAGGLHESRSLPSLLPAVAFGGTGAAAPSGFPGSPPTKAADSLSWR